MYLWWSIVNSTLALAGSAATLPISGLTSGSEHVSAVLFAPHRYLLSCVPVPVSPCRAAGPAIPAQPYLRASVAEQAQARLPPTRRYRGSHRRVTILLWGIPRVGPWV